MAIKKIEAENITEWLSKKVGEYSTPFKKIIEKMMKNLLILPSAYIEINEEHNSYYGLMVIKDMHIFIPEDMCKVINDIIIHLTKAIKHNIYIKELDIIKLNINELYDFVLSKYSIYEDSAMYKEYIKINSKFIVDGISFGSIKKKLVFEGNTEEFIEDFNDYVNIIKPKEICCTGKSGFVITNKYDEIYEKYKKECNGCIETFYVKTKDVYKLCDIHIKYKYYDTVIEDIIEDELIMAIINISRILGTDINKAFTKIGDIDELFNVIYRINKDVELDNNGEPIRTIIDIEINKYILGKIKDKSTIANKLYELYNNIGYFDMEKKLYEKYKSIKPEEYEKREELYKYVDIQEKLMKSIDVYAFIYSFNIIPTNIELDKEMSFESLIKKVYKSNNFAIVPHAIISHMLPKITHTRIVYNPKSLRVYLIDQYRDVLLSDIFTCYAIKKHKEKLLNIQSDYNVSESDKTEEINILTSVFYALFDINIETIYKTVESAYNSYKSQIYTVVDAQYIDYYDVLETIYEYDIEEITSEAELYDIIKIIYETKI